MLIFSHVCKSFLLLSDMTHPTPPHHWTRTSSTTTRQCPSGHLKPPWPLTRPSLRSATSDHNSNKVTWSKGRPHWRRSPRRSCNPARRRFPSRPLTIHSTARCSSTRSRSCHIQDWWPATTTQQLSNPWACRRPRPLQPTPPTPPPPQQPPLPTFPSSRHPPRKSPLRAAAATLWLESQLKAFAIFFPPFPLPGNGHFTYFPRSSINNPSNVAFL